VSAALAGAPSLAVGDLLGSDMANMAILGVIDLPPELDAIVLRLARLGALTAVRAVRP